MELLAAIAAGIAIGYVAGGRLKHLASVRIASLWLLLGAIALQLSGRLFPVDERLPAILLSYAIIAVWIFRSAVLNAGTARVAVVVLGLGWLLNIIVIAANGGMPVSRDAMDTAGLPRNYSVTDGSLYKHVPLDDGTELSFLADVIPAKAPLRNVYSIGDVVLLAGIVAFVAAGMSRTTSASATAQPRTIAEQPLG